MVVDRACARCTLIATSQFAVLCEACEAPLPKASSTAKKATKRTAPSLATKASPTKAAKKHGAALPGPDATQPSVASFFRRVPEEEPTTGARESEAKCASSSDDPVPPLRRSASPAPPPSSSSSEGSQKTVALDDVWAAEEADAAVVDLTGDDEEKRRAAAEEEEPRVETVAPSSSRDVAKKNDDSKKADDDDGGISARARLILPVASFDPLAGPRQDLFDDDNDGAVLYGVVGATLDVVSSTTKRLTKESALTNALRWVARAALDGRSGAVDEEVVATCYLLAPVRDAQVGGHRLEPDWESRALGLAHRVVERASLDGTGLSPAELKKVFAGTSSYTARRTPFLASSTKPKEALGVARVRRDLIDLGRLSGAKAERAKAERLTRLFRAARSASEVRWLSRTCHAHMTCGISLEASIVPALARAFLVEATAVPATSADFKAVEVAARRAYARRADLAALVRALRAGAAAAAALFLAPSSEGKKNPSQGSKKKKKKLTKEKRDEADPPSPAALAFVGAVGAACVVAPGAPPAPMLASPATSVEDALVRSRKQVYAGLPTTTTFLAEYKYDGQRAQVHRTAEGVVRIFSRKSDDITKKYPEVVEAMMDTNLASGALVLDAEIVPTDAEGRLLSFQVLSTRKKKVDEGDDAGPRVKLVVFDALWLQGADVTQLPLADRRARLKHTLFPPSSCGEKKTTSDHGIVALAVSIEVADSDEACACVLDVLHSAVTAGCEGLVLKRLEAPYEFALGSRRSDAWIKLKKDYLEGLGDTLDLVPVGGWRGQGRKRRWISPILMAARDPETGRLGSVCRVMSGFSDEFYRAFTVQTLGAEMALGGEDVLPASPAPRHAFVDTAEDCPFWFFFDPVATPSSSEVWEIRGADITVSPVHRAAVGLVHADRGLSLRFPRFLRKRPDKALADATTPHQLVAMYQAQAQGQRKRALAKQPEDDDYDDDGYL